MKKAVVIIVIFLFFIFLTIAEAHNNSDYEFYGFSPDRKYCAFELFGDNVDEGLKYSRIYLINVTKNEYEIKPFIVENEDDNIPLLEIRQKNIQKAIPYLHKYQLNSFEKGTLLFMNPRNGAYIHPQEKINEYRNSFVIGDEVYTIELLEKDAGEQLGWSTKMFELYIKSKENTFVLQKDSKLPESRKYALKYRLAAAYYFYGVIAVFIEYEVPGFEGNDRRQMIVTGIIKTQDLGMQYD